MSSDFLTKYQSWCYIVDIGYMEAIKGFGERLKEKRKEVRLTQSDLGDILSLKQTSISEFEAGRAYPSFHALTGLAAALNCSLDWLCRGSEWGGDLYRTKSTLRLELDSYLDKLKDDDLPPLIDLASGTAFRRAKSMTSER